MRSRAFEFRVPSSGSTVRQAKGAVAIRLEAVPISQQPGYRCYSIGEVMRHEVEIQEPGFFKEPLHRRIDSEHDIHRIL